MVFGEVYAARLVTKAATETGIAPRIERRGL